MQTSPRKHTNISKQTVEELLACSGCFVDDQIKERLFVYFNELDAWNRKINLTGIKNLRQRVLKHLGDTLTLVQIIPQNVKYVLDIGTGAGIPGLILAILRPDLEITLLDAKRKRISFLLNIIAKTGLNNVKCHHGRAGEKVFPATIPEGGFDLVVSQATVSSYVLCQWSLPLIESDGIIIAMKGPEVYQELQVDKDQFKNQAISVEVKKALTPLTDIERFFVIIKREEKIT